MEQPFQVRYEPHCLSLCTATTSPALLKAQAQALKLLGDFAKDVSPQGKASNVACMDIVLIARVLSAGLVVPEATQCVLWTSALARHGRFAEMQQFVRVRPTSLKATEARQLSWLG